LGIIADGIQRVYLRPTCAISSGRSRRFNRQCKSLGDDLSAA
jgi:hypothetical protein